MNRARILFLQAASVALAFSLMSGLTGCGGSSTPRMLESMSISPASGMAVNGQLQLVATGTFNTSPETVTPLAVNWVGPPFPQANPVACSLTNCPVFISNSGLVSCNSAVATKSTYSFTASAPADPKLPLNSVNVVMVTATASVTCP